MKPLRVAVQRRVPCCARGSSTSVTLHLQQTRANIRSLATHASSTPKKRGSLRRILLYSTTTLAGAYGAATILALYNERFHDTFVEYLPYGNEFIELARQQGWKGHSVDPAAVLRTAKATIDKLDNAATGSVSRAQKWIDNARSKASGSQPIKHTNTELPSGSSGGVLTSTATPTTPQRVSSPDAEVAAVHINTEDSAQQDVSQITQRAEDALAIAAISPEEPGPSETEETSDPRVYTAELPLGFEIPPGFITQPQYKSESSSSQAAASGHKVDQSSQTSSSQIPDLPLITPSLPELVSSDPVLFQLASIIDHLASFLEKNPSVSINSSAKQLLETAQEDLTALGERFQTMKEQEKVKLEQRLEEQTREFSLQLLQLELTAQDRLDQQDEQWRKFAEEERQQLIHAYRAKLEAELQAQTEIINQRLKEEVIAQGIELQRRWVREVKVHVETERGGRLAKLDELAADVKRLSRVTLDNSEYLDENLRLHALRTSIRSLEFIIQHSASRKPFRNELRILRHALFAGGVNEDRLISAALDVLEDGTTPDIGVEPFADLASWLTASVVPRLCSVALVPDENAGILSYLASSVLSSLRIRRRGYVEGNDVYNVVSRAEYYMNEKDLDSAARELNQLTGPAKELLHDWLEATRMRLEALQALEVVKTQAALASLLLIK